MKITELAGAQLDYWAAQAEGLDVRYCSDRSYVIVATYQWSPSTRWSEAGPLIERERGMIAPEMQGDGRPVIFCASMGTGVNRYQCFGPTHLIAAMRAFVGSRFGAEVTGEEV